MPRPQPVIGCDVKHQPTPYYGAIQRSGIAQISLNHFQLKLADFAPGPNQCPYRVSALEQLSGYMPPDKTGRAGYQSRLHSIKVYRNAQVISLNVSPSFALIPRAAEGSKPQCTMQ